MVYIIFFFILIFGTLVTKSRKESVYYLFMIMILLLAIISLRDVSVGTDTLSYTEDFIRFSHMSFSEMWNYAFTTKEPLYVIISWIPSLLSTNYTCFLLVWALFPVCSLYKVFKAELQDSKDFFIAILVFFLLGLFAFYVAGIRQTAALSLVFFAGAKYLREYNMKDIKSVIKGKVIYCFAIFIGLAYLIHNSSVLFLLAIPLVFLKVRWWYLFLVFGLFFIGKYVQIDQVVLLSKLFFEDRFATYGTVYESSQNISALIMQIILFLICFIVKDKLVRRDTQNNFFFNLLFIGLVFQSLSEMMAEMARISFYFSMFAMILVPRAFKEYSTNYRKFIYFGFSVVCLYYLFFLTGSNLPEYHSVL
ncbi:EpsG family protein [Parabacteroides johnsonii]